MELFERTVISLLHVLTLVLEHINVLAMNGILEMEKLAAQVNAYNYYIYAINACIQKQNILKGQLFFPISSLFFLFYLFLSRGPGGTFRNNIIHILFYIILY